VWDPATLAAPVAAAVVGARAVRYLWGLDIMGRGATLVERLPASYGRVYERFGQELPADPDWWTFDPSPPSVWPVTTGTRRAVRYVPYSPHNEPPQSVYAAGRRPRVLLTFGAGIAMKEFVAVDGFAASPVMRGVTALDVDIVVAAAPADVPALGPLPPEVEVVTGCPLSALLPSCSVVVHHAGNGTLLTAGLAGVPQIVVSHLPESVFSARQFEPTGAVRHLPAGEVTAELIRDGVAQALADAQWRRATEALRAEMLAQPVPGELLAELAAA
jgi:UDP:flavonoid glycosyltransferase YjiC (YdhE family)